LGFPLLIPFSILAGIVTGFQAYAVGGDQPPDDQDDTLAILQKKAEERSRKRP
jgi:hypothetical protein